MEKPASIRRRELKETIAKALNEAQLPPYVNAEILSEFLQQSVDLIERQYHQDLKKWEQIQKGEEQKQVNEEPVEETQ